MKKLALILTVLTLSLSLAACSASAQTEPTPAEAAAAAAVETKVQAVELYGKIAPQTSTHLTFKQSFKVEKLLVKAGDIVKKGSPLAKIDLSSQESDLALLKLQVKQLEQQLGSGNTAYKQANAAVESASAKVLLAQKEYDKQKALYDANSIAKQDLDRAKDDLDSAKREVSTAQITAQGALQSGKQTNASLSVDLSKAKQQVEQLSAFLTNPNFKDGHLINTLDSAIVANVTMQSGLFAGAQESTIELYDAQALVVKANVSEENLKEIKIGQTVSVKPLMDSTKEYTGKVNFISAKAEVVNGETMIPLEILLDKSEGLLPNLNVDITVPLK